jgi:D-alanine-D-alanine ligase
MQITRVGVLRGGISDEYDVSLRTGAHVIASLRSHQGHKYEPVDIVVSKGGEWLRQGRVRAPHEALSDVDVVFIALHGVFGEDGTVQRLLERLGLPYVGTGPYGSMIALHKGMAKDHVHRHGIRVPRHVLVEREISQNLQNTAVYIHSHIRPAYIVKPVSGGSSIGVHKAHSVLELEHVLRKALNETSVVLVEEMIVGREATVGVIEGFRNTPHYVLPPIEIISPTTGYFDYETKYGDGSHEVCPSTFPNHTKEALERLAREVHTALGLRHYSRSDFMVSDDGIYFLEANTLPGLTEASLIPKALSAVGARMDDFLDHLLTAAYEERRTPVA